MIGWLVSALGMFGLSYLWHGVFLNDYKRINFPFGMYMLMAAVTYLVIGLVLSRAFIVKYFDRISRHPLLRGPAIGLFCGIIVFVIATTVQITNPGEYGSIVTFNTGYDPKFFLLDLMWQGLEQSAGGFLVGLVYMFVFEPMPLREED